MYGEGGGAHLGLDEFEPLVNVHDGLGPVLLDEDRADEFVDVCVFVQSREFLPPSAMRSE